jgi:lysophospholipase L1-like esterase
MTWFDSPVPSLNLHSRFRLPRLGKRRRPATRMCRAKPRLTIECLEDRSLPSATLSIGAMGDSLTASYAGQPYGAAGDQSWAVQLQTLRAEHITIYNEAVPGTTSTTLLSQGQDTAVAGLVAGDAVDAAVLIVGANDVGPNLQAIFAGDPTLFVNTVVSNIEAAVNTVEKAGHVKLEIGNIPDVGLTPFFRTFVTNNPFLLGEVTQAVKLADAEIEVFAASQGLPVVDLYGLGQLATQPLQLGGVTVDNLYAPDGFHPNTIGQGLLANTILDAFHIAYHTKIQQLRLSDQELLTEAGIDHHGGKSFFDIRRFVIFNQDDDSDNSRFDKELSSRAPLHSGTANDNLAAGRLLAGGDGFGSVAVARFVDASSPSNANIHWAFVSPEGTDSSRRTDVPMDHGPTAPNPSQPADHVADVFGQTQWDLWARALAD